MLVLHPPITNDLPHLLHNLLLAARRTPHGEIDSGVQWRIPIPRVATRDDAARLGQDAPARADIPRVAPALPVHIQPALGHSTEVQRRRAQVADRVDHCAVRLPAGRKAAERLNLDVKVGPVAAGPPLAGHERRRQVAQRGGLVAVALSRGRQAHPLAALAAVLEDPARGQRGVALRVGTFARDARVQLVLEGVVDHADAGLAADREAQRDARVGKPVDEVGRAVYGVLMVTLVLLRILKCCILEHSKT